MWLDVAQSLAYECLRERPILSANARSLNSGDRLPPVCCSFQNCTWTSDSIDSSGVYAEDYVEHPWDCMLKEHVRQEHGSTICTLVHKHFGTSLVMENGTDRTWNVYKEAIAIRERDGFPIVGTSIDRRAFEYLMEVYNDAKVYK